VDDPRFGTATSEIDLTDSHTWSGLPAPFGWHVIQRKEHGLMWERVVGERLTVWEDVSVKRDGKNWLHVSVAKSNPKKRPSYDDLHVVRLAFIGEDRECYQKFPPKARYVSFTETLHLWCCLDEPEGVLPAFEEMVAFLDMDTGKVEERYSI